MDTDDLRRAVADGMPQTIADLERLVRIPSIGAPGYDPSLVRASAETTVEILRSAGVGDARLLELDGGHPAVRSDRRAGRRSRPCSSTPTTTCSPRDRPTGGRAPRSIRSCARAALRPRRGRRQERHRRARGPRCARSACRMAHAARHGADRHRGRGGMFHRTPPQLVQGHADLLRADVAVIADGGN